MQNCAGQSRNQQSPSKPSGTPKSHNSKPGQRSSPKLLAAQCPPPSCCGSVLSSGLSPACPAAPTSLWTHTPRDTLTQDPPWGTQEARASRPRRRGHLVLPGAPTLKPTSQGWFCLLKHWFFPNPSRETRQPHPRLGTRICSCRRSQPGPWGPIGGGDNRWGAGVDGTRPSGGPHFPRPAVEARDLFFKELGGAPYGGDQRCCWVHGSALFPSTAVN